MNTETEELDYDAYAAEARARMRKVLAGLERANEEQPTPQLATAIIKAQEKLDHYCGFKGVSALLPDTPMNRAFEEMENILNPPWD